MRAISIAIVGGCLITLGALTLSRGSRLAAQPSPRFFVYLPIVLKNAVLVPRLPAALPTVHKLSFDAPQAQWPPRPGEQLNLRIVPWEEIPGSLTDALEAQIRAAAEQDPGVRQALGARFAYISTDEVELPKGQVRQPNAPLATRVTFYSHTNNIAVLVLMRGVQVQSLSQRQGYQPPEGADEITSAIALARRDPRLAPNVTGLTGSALLAPGAPGTPGFGRRILYVSFAASEEAITRFYALVDLTNETVIEAGRR